MGNNNYFGSSEILGTNNKEKKWNERGKNVNDLLTNILLNKEVYQALGNQVLVSTWPIIIELKHRTKLR